MVKREKSPVIRDDAKYLVIYQPYPLNADFDLPGWKRIQVEPDWFTERGWNLTDGPFKHPYPDSLWCKPLAEDPTGKPIARPLPTAVKPPPPDAPSLVPGSVEWVEATSGSGGPSPGTPSSASASGSTTQRGRGTAKGQRGAEKARGGRGGGRRGRPAHIQDPSAAPVQTLAAGNSNPYGVTQAYVPSISPSLVFQVYRVRDEAPRAISVPTTCHLAWDDEEDQHRSPRFSSYSSFSFCFSFTCFSEDSKFSSESCECGVPVLGRPGGPGSAA
ncbi:hypothetical protein EST38_g5125 [Candolleomyces aberdarensis]|uniref:Uncharacterized protein n=1 Tax=Candolleomyces aberdarensis TaxID=2316362 RepID=A0A4V1Q437_9AGAR|nr:hypothetical protein EST38_g5125 [Candolleomyces aberdarensis]